MDKFAKTTELINGAILAGGELAILAMQAFTEIRAESGMTKAEIIADARRLHGDSVAAEIELKHAAGIE